MQRWEVELELKAEGRAEGRKEGETEAERKMAAITAQLLKEKRYDDLERMTEDEEYRHQLMEELAVVAK